MKNSRKQILYLCADRGIALGGRKGASIHIREFVETLREAGYEVIVAASKEAQGSSYNPDYPVHILPDTIDLPSNLMARSLQPQSQGVSDECVLR